MVCSIGPFTLEDQSGLSVCRQLPFREQRLSRADTDLSSSCTVGINGEIPLLIRWICSTESTLSERGNRYELVGSNIFKQPLRLHLKTRNLPNKPKAIQKYILSKSHTSALGHLSWLHPDLLEIHWRWAASRQLWANRQVSMPVHELKMPMFFALSTDNKNRRVKHLSTKYWKLLQVVKIILERGGD